ncbi:hypothetical protein FJR11_10805 [Anabaena sp. UHCC 0187]|uniref:hypothetical protein n=1 Tax=Anabaena sp. UHCC 0187 TaxID=2590018 RepID=UPI001447E922|nr:hypothetical protein [Anabaena sp. UHCC 0187]MTJ13073.1 hypothetical protein [Anabaena sp. UHCC 0187]
MFLYHGTSFENVPRILSQGLLPRRSGNGNWSMPESNSYESRKDAVYLSNAYAPYFSSISSANTGNKRALVEIDIDSLEQDNLYPDEDFLTYSSNLLSEIGKTVEERTPYFRENLESYQDYLQDSLQKMGNCCYIGIISPTAISRITTWCKDDVKILHRLSYGYVEEKGGVTPFHDQEDSQILRLLTKCFAKREFQIDELLSLCQKKFQIDDNFDYDKTKDILIQEMEKIEIVYDKDYDTI